MKKIVCIMVMLLSVMMTFAGGILYDVSFERRIDMLNLEGESYDSVLVKFDVGSVSDKSVKVTIWNKKGKRIYRHTFRKMNCARETGEDDDDNLIVVGKPSMFFLMIKKCDDGPKLCVVREREGLTKSNFEYLLEYFRNRNGRKNHHR